MAFDAGMLACVISQIKGVSLGARIERVFQPEKDEIVLQMRSFDGGKRLLINAGSNNPRIGFCSQQKENPAAPPMLCMLLRKHLQGSKLVEVKQEGFERVVTLSFETRDEMGFECRKYLIAELMGKYSNLMFCDENKKIVAAMRTVDFSTSGLRQVLPGMTYELPPKQEKVNPMEVTPEEFASILSAAPAEKPCDKFLFSAFLGLSSAVAREIVYRAFGRFDLAVAECDPLKLSNAFFGLFDSIKAEKFSPCMVLDAEKPVEYAFCKLSHYPAPIEVRDFENASLLLESFFGTRDREQHIHQKAGDILKILTNADTRIRKKLDLQSAELAECEKGAAYKKAADLITANLYQLKRGMTHVELVDYEDMKEDGSFGSVAIELDSRLSPASNAQRFYKKYNKAKNAKIELAKQIELGKTELYYLDSVFEALSHAETAADLTEIRDELYRSGYASKMKHYTLSKKSPVPQPAEFRTGGGFKVLCGKNNVQNEYLTHKLADKNDYWFHVKNLPGSHTVLFCNGVEPGVSDFTEAAEIAAYFSKGADGQNVEVDYTKIKNVKKPPAGKPGLVIYHTNWSCIVTPNAKKIEKLRK